MDAFLPKNNESIISFIIEHLEEEHYGYVSDIPDDMLQEMVANGIKRAQQYDFTELADLTVFVTWMFLMAPNFDENPKLKEILQNLSISPDERIEKLLVAELNSNWEDVQEAYNADAWFPELLTEE